MFKMSPVYKNRFTLGGRSLPETYDSNFGTAPTKDPTASYGAPPTFQRTA